jgi:hypothetical protein
MQECPGARRTQIASDSVAGTHPRYNTTKLRYVAFLTADSGMPVSPVRPANSPPGRMRGLTASVRLFSS